MFSIWTKRSLLLKAECWVWDKWLVSATVLMTTDNMLTISLTSLKLKINLYCLYQITRTKWRPVSRTMKEMVAVLMVSIILFRKVLVVVMKWKQCCSNVVNLPPNITSQTSSGDLLLMSRKFLISRYILSFKTVQLIGDQLKLCCPQFWIILRIKVMV